MSNKYFYERSKFSEFKSNTTYHQLLEMTDDEFVSCQWAQLFVKKLLNNGMKRNSPVIKKNEKGIINNFKKLKSNPKYWEKDTSGDEESLSY